MSENIEPLNIINLEVIYDIFNAGKTKLNLMCLTSFQDAKHMFLEIHKKNPKLDLTIRETYIINGKEKIRTQVLQLKK